MERKGSGGAGITVVIPDKLYFKIGEVCEITGVKQHALRYWESEFKSLRPQRASSKQRLYKRKDVENILKIKKLLQDEGFTIAGAKKALAKEKGAKQKKAKSSSPKKMSMGDRTFFKGIKAELKEIKEMLE